MYDALLLLFVLLLTSISSVQATIAPDSLLPKYANNKFINSETIDWAIALRPFESLVAHFSVRFESHIAARYHSTTRDTTH